VRWVAMNLCMMTRAAGVGGFLLFLGACATTYINPTATRNPPPEVAFNQYESFELESIAIPAKYADHEANQAAVAKIERGLNEKLGPTLDRWNSSEDKAPRGTLVIEPVVRDIKFIGGGVRFWAGSMAGSSAVIIDVSFRDAETGEVIAEPEFYQHANASAGGWSVGGADNAMLNRMATLIMEYVQSNYASAIGGRTGAPVEE
jgi:hypothetical protein